MTSLSPLNRPQVAPAEPGKAAGQATQTGSVDQRLLRQCQEFEAVLVQQMFKGLRATVPEGGLISKNNSQEIFQDLMDLELSRSLATGRGIGIADTLYRQLKSPSPGSEQD